MQEKNDKNINNSFIVTNIRFVDPKSRTDICLDKRGGLVIEKGYVADIGANLLSNDNQAGLPVIDGGGKILCPGLIDTNVFAGAPGYAHRENLKTTSLAASAGGVTSIVIEPHMNPVNDNVAVLDFIRRRSRDESFVHIHPKTALTRELKGKVSTEIGMLFENGARIFGDGPFAVQDSRLMYMVMLYCKAFDCLIVGRPSDDSLANGGVLHDGEQSLRLGLPPITELAETVMLERDLRLSRYVNIAYHASLLSCRTSCEIMRKAKETMEIDDSKLSASVSINNLLLIDADIGTYRSFYKLDPPLREPHDRDALIEALASGVIDIITSNHVPQSSDKKRLPFINAAFGSVGLESLLSCSLSLYHNGRLSLLDLLACLTINPARIFRIDGGYLSRGAPGDFIIFDIDCEVTISPQNFHSRGHNSCHAGRVLRGKVLSSYVMGKLVYECSS